MATILSSELFWCCGSDRKRKFRTVSEIERQRKLLPRKTAAMAAFLLFVGVVFLISGFVTWWQSGTSEATPFWILGGITFAPGSYASFVLLMTYLGRKGYRYDHIPSYDE